MPAPASFGSPRPAFIRNPRIYQTATGGTTLTVGSTPGTGSVIIVGAASVSHEDYTVSGAGATWAKVGFMFIDLGAQYSCALWIGKVGTSPNSSISVPFTNSGHSVGIVIGDGFDGIIRASTSLRSAGACQAVVCNESPFQRRQLMAVYFQCARETSSIPAVTGVGTFTTRLTSTSDLATELAIRTWTPATSFRPVLADVSVNQGIVAGLFT